ncbi:hypothetical protein LT493_08870 [Streptomyces tricolor]|nr:hypothetical protein [Streptomyces tricolor]
MNPATAATADRPPPPGSPNPGGSPSTPRAPCTSPSGAGHRVRAIGADGMIRTVAGTGEPGSGPDAVPGPASALHHPIDLAAGTDGRLYIADCFSHRVRVVEPDGVIGTVAGTGEPGAEGRAAAPSRAGSTSTRHRLPVHRRLAQQACLRADFGRCAAHGGRGPAPPRGGGRARATGARLRLPRALVLTSEGA